MLHKCLDLKLYQMLYTATSVRQLFGNVIFCADQMINYKLFLLAEIINIVILLTMPSRFMFSLFSHFKIWSYVTEEGTSA